MGVGIVLAETILMLSKIKDIQVFIPSHSQSHRYGFKFASAPAFPF
jgi:hypothetical protein